MSGKELPARARVVIIGGGVTGCSIAYHLAHLGWTDVVLLEQHELTAGTTWHAAGLITSAGMTDETALFFSRYSRDLYARLEEETGHSTGFNPVGHVSLATTPQRLEALRRSSAWMHGFGVAEHEISARELQEMWPLLDTSDVLAGFYVPDEGRADPVGVATSMAKGAKALGARIIEGVAVTGVETKRGRVSAVLTSQGRIETEIVVNAAGMWARQLGALNDVCIPLQAAEHYYLITDAVPGMDKDLAVIEDPERYGYYRPEGDGMLVGLFEPVGAPWSLDGVPDSFAFGTMPPDWDRMGPYLGAALERIPSLSEVGVRLFFCGPESFTPDIRPMLGPAPELDGYFVAAGMNSLGILMGGGIGNVMAHWIVDGVPPVDVTGYAVDRAATHETSRRFRAERTVEQLGVLFGDATWPSWKPGSARDVRRSVLHDRLVAAGGHFNASVGWEFAEWYDADGAHPATTLDYARQGSFEIVGREHRAVREDVGVLDVVRVDVRVTVAEPLAESDAVALNETEAVTEMLLPLAPPQAAAATAKLASDDYDFEPSAESILEELLPASFMARLFKCFLDAAVSEQVARMVAMKAATENAGGLIKNLSRQYNRARQSQITGEIMEILGGVEALKQ